MITKDMVKRIYWVLMGLSIMVGTIVGLLVYSIVKDSGYNGIWVVLLGCVVGIITTAVSYIQAIEEVINSNSQ